MEDNDEEAAGESQDTAEVELTQIEKMVNASMEYLHRHNAPGADGEVGSYDTDLIKDACQKILNGAVHVDTGYGIIMTRLYFETANLL